MNTPSIVHRFTDRIRGGRRTYLAASAVAAVVLVALIGFRIDTDPQEQANDDARDIIARLGELMELPDEEPIIATVQDPTQFADQPYFRNASVGDKVIIYNGARKAILFNPGTDRIVDIAPLRTDNAEPTSAPIR